MSTIKVEVCEILEIKPHTNADALELATVQGWQMCVKKGVHQPGDLVVYFEQGTVLTKEVADRLNVGAYLAEKTDINGDRVLVVHRIKLRGEPSFGLVVHPEAGMRLGEDVAEFYSATKYYPPIKVQAGDSAVEDSYFPKYTNLENMRSYPNLLQVGEAVVATEKIHGCLTYKTKISMWGGGHKPIHKIEIGEFVAGMNAQGEIVPNKVLNKFNNGSAEKWLNVRGKRKIFDSGNPFFSIYCTPSHHFYCPREGCYKEAINLTAEDRVLIIHDSNSLTYIEEQILLGKLLGDGSLQKTKDSDSSAVRFSHKKDHEEYLNFCVDSLKHKLPISYRGRKVPVIPATEQKYTPIIRSVDIYSVEEAFNVDSSRWDLETETHNFFANSILVHNSNCRVGFVWHPDEEQPTMMAGSRTLRRKEPENPTMMVANTYWFPHTLIGVKNLLADLQSQGHKQVILYGEVYGQGIQAYTYGAKRIDFRAFDLMLDGKYVDYPVFKNICDRHQVNQVPLVYQGAFSLDAIGGVSDGDSLIGGTHGREGVVVKPIVERDDPKSGRVILKYIGDRYLFGKVAQQDTTDI